MKPSQKSQVTDFFPKNCKKGKKKLIRTSIHKTNILSHQRRKKKEMMKKKTLLLFIENKRSSSRYLYLLWYDYQIKYWNSVIFFFYSGNNQLFKSILCNMRLYVECWCFFLSSIYFSKKILRIKISLHWNWLIIVVLFDA